MRIRTATDLGLLIRERRKALKLDQKALADRAGVGRQWIVAIEQGKASAELGLVLQTLEALGLRVQVEAGLVVSERPSLPTIDLGVVIDRGASEQAVTGDVLVALLHGREVGRLVRLPGAGLEFTYDDDWRNASEAHPLSLSLPLNLPVHRGAVVEAFVSGLLPDNDYVIERWARRFQVSAWSAFGLLANVGEDCAGAVQFVLPERVTAVTNGTRTDVEWLTEEDVGERLRDLRADASAWRSARDTGQFSLAGAQPKTALLFLDGRWGVPSGRLPTTHILKPPIEGFDGHAENEHFCLSLAWTLGLPTAKSRVQSFDGERAIVIERYDRIRAVDLPGMTTATERALLSKRQPIVRLHQEDLCQALGVHPERKYQNNGGPSPGQVAALLRRASDSKEADVRSFADALLFSWLVAGPDAHAKNYSVLHGQGGQVRLAPLYDLASALPYKDLPAQKLKLAMKFGATYRLKDIRRSDLERLADELGLPPEELVSRAIELVRAFPEAVEEVRKRLVREKLRHPLVKTLADALVVRAQQVGRLLTAKKPAP